ncbi:MAG: hypothetical protein QNL97_03340 [Pseudomonadales bacterium]
MRELFEILLETICGDNPVIATNSNNPVKFRIWQLTLWGAIRELHLF